MGPTQRRSELAELAQGALPIMTRYEPVRLLGRGGMGAVYEVVDRRSGRRVALKKILTPDPRQQLRFKREFRLMADLRHPNLVQLFDLGLEDDTWFFTMELIEGASWLDACGRRRDAAADRLAESTRDLEARGVSQSWDTPPSDRDASATIAAPASAASLEDVRELLAQLLAALAFLHQQGIVHRDLKPSNVLVDRDGQVKVLDFGLASQLERDQEFTQALSRTGVALGTVAYMAPEQLQGQPVTAKADLYSLGCMLFQALTGRLPHTGSPAKILEARLHEPAPRVERYVDDVPEELCAVCRALLDRDPERRPTIDALRDALGLPHSTPDPTSGQTASPFASDAELPFVGRQQELEQLTALLERACAGELRFQLIEGESGIGKSALARQLVRQAKQRGALCLRGRCYEREHLPFVAFDRAIDALTLTLSRWPAALVDPIKPALLAASRIFSALRMLVDDPAPGWREAADRGEQLHAALDGLAAIIDHCQREAPLLLVLDDLQWADEESVALLEVILSRCTGRIMILGLLRPREPSGDPVAARLQALARGRAAAPVLQLEPLRSGDCAALIELAGRDRLAPDILEGLARRTEGNPLLALQVIDHLALLELDARDAYLRSLESSRGVIEALVKHFDAPTRRLLQLAATAGADIDEALLRDASGLSDAQYSASRQALLAAHMLRRPSADELARDDDGPPRARLDVYHDRIRETVYDTLDPALRRELHRAVARALEAHQGAHGRDVEALLRHWAAAGEDGLCRALALEASERAEAKLAFRRAVTLLRFALDRPADEDDGQEARRWERLGDLCEFTSQLAEALHAYRRALALREETSDASTRRVALLRLQGRIGETLVMAGQIRDGRESFGRGMTMIGLSLDRRRGPGLFLWLLLALWLVTNAPARFTRRASTEWLREQIRFLTLATRVMAPLWPSLAVELSLRGTILGLRVGDQRYLQRLLATRVLGLVLQGRPTRRALEHARRDLDASEALALKLEIPFGLEVVMMHRALHALAFDTTRALRVIEEALAAIDRGGMRESYDGAIARVIRLMILFRRGEYDEALVLISHELDQHGNVLNVSIVLFFEVLIYAHRGQLERARASMARLEASFAPFPPCGLTSRRDIVRVSLAVAEGRFDEGLAYADGCERAWAEHDIPPKGDFRSLWLTAAAEAAIGRLRAGGDQPARSDILSTARRRARELARRGTLDHACMGHRALALLAHLEGRSAAAVRSIDRALALSATNTSPYRRWLCLEAASDVGRMTLDIKSEARALQAQVGFMLPPGW